MQTPTMTTDKAGTISYSLNGKWHREDGPAVIYADGTQAWYLNDLFHREDGPAYIGVDGTQWWYLNGLYHRTDGPAIIRTNGTHAWCLNGRKYSFTDYCKQLKLPDEDIIILKLKYNTCIPV